MSERPEYELIGSKVETMIHNYKGICVGIQYNLGYSTQAVVQAPIGKDGKIPDALVFDIHVCKFSSKLAKSKLPAIEDFDVGLGDEVEDVVTGFKGICTAIACGFNGCVEIVVVAKVDKELKSRVHAQNNKRFKITKKAAVTIATATVDSKPSDTQGAIHHSTAMRRGA